MSYTMRQYVAEVQNRARRYTATATFDGSTMENVINEARHIVQSATLEVVPERYARQWMSSNPPVESAEESVRVTVYDTVNGGVTTVLNRTYVFTLPADFISMVDVSVLDASSDLWQARRVTKRELYVAMSRSFTMPTSTNPIYCVEKRTGDATARVLVSAGNDIIDETDVTFWYLAKLPFLQTVVSNIGATDTDVRIGYDLQELVLNIALLRLLESSGIQESYDLIRRDVDLAVTAFEGQYKGAIDRSLLLTQAREGAIPNMPIIEV